MIYNEINVITYITLLLNKSYFLVRVIYRRLHKQSHKYIGFTQKFHLFPTIQPCSFESSPFLCQGIEILWHRKVIVLSTSCYSFIWESQEILIVIFVKPVVGNIFTLIMDTLFLHQKPICCFRTLSLV